MREECQKTGNKSEPCDNLNNGRAIQVRYNDLIHRLRHALEGLLSGDRSTTIAKMTMLYGCGVSGAGSKKQGGCIRYGPADTALFVMSSTARRCYLQLRESVSA
jgi:hypothetical protein